MKAMGSSSRQCFGVSTLCQAKRAVKVVIGFTVLLVGVALIVLPGPASLVIPVGLAILAGEFVWARRLLDRFNTGLNGIKNSFSGPFRKNGD
jgi:tellurite resistance protein TerC